MIQLNLLFVLCFSIFVQAGEPALSALNPDPGLRDIKTDPCENFYQYACGDWIAKTKIPADKPAWDRSFSTIAERNRLILKDILQKYSKKDFEPKNPYAQKLGDLYASCMDESKLATGAMSTFKKQLKFFDTVSKENLPERLAWMHLSGMNALFSFGDTQDFKNPLEVTAEISQGGLGLPTKDYYLDSSEKMQGLRQKYLQHIQKLFQLSGESSKSAKSNANKVLAFETRIAEISLAPAELRDPTKLYHRTDFVRLQKEMPDFNWSQYLEGIQLSAKEPVNNSIPRFSAGLDEILKSTNVEDLKAYMRLKFIEGSAKGLPNKFYEENFSFYGKTLAGAEKAPVRWKRCVDSAVDLMGFALGRSFVDLTFAGPSKAIAIQMIQQIEKIQNELIENAPWMDSKTKVAAKEKIRNLANQIGYPEIWRNYDSLQITRDSYLANRYNGAKFNHLYHLAKIGKPLDRSDWGMSPSEVNAYYDPQMTKMVFPAGILQPPFFDAQYSSAGNFGGIGMVMGHELTHGFDDEGRQFDSKGAMVDWWTPKVAEEFEKRGSCLVKQYDSYATAGRGHVNGKLTLGENIADQGGVKSSFLAWKETLPKEIQKDESKLREEERNYFLAFAQAWCGKTKDEFEQVQVASDPHSPNRYRVNGALSNFAEFARVYECKVGTKMAPENQCVIW